MPIDLYPNIAKVKRNGVYQNLPGFVQQSGDADIEAMLAISESSTTAQYNHPKGSYFILNDVLYKAKIDIAVNDTIAVGTNCEVAILCDDINEIESTIIGYIGHITPQMFGAKGDGVTDDTTSLQNSLEYAYEHRTKLYIPTGTYITTLPLFIPPDLHIEGELEGKTIIQKINHATHDSPPDGYRTSDIYNLDAVFILINKTSFTYTWYRYLQVENITILGCTTDATESQYGIAFPTSSDMVFSNISVKNVSYGLSTTSSSVPVYLSSFKDIYVLARNVGMQVTNNLCEYDNIFIEFTSELAIGIAGNCFAGTIGISNAKGGYGINLNGGLIGTISFEDCTGLDEYIRINGKPHINRVSAYNMTVEKAPNNYLIHSLGSSSPIIDNIILGGTSESIPVLIRIEGNNSFNKIGAIENISVINTIQSHNENAFNTLYINDVLQYKPYQPQNGMIYTLGTVPEIYQNAWLPIVTAVEDITSTFITLIEGLTIDTQLSQITKEGKHIYGLLQVTSDADLTSNSYAIGTIASGYRPKTYYFGLDMLTTDKWSTGKPLYKCGFPTTGVVTVNQAGGGAWRCATIWLDYYSA